VAEVSDRFGDYGLVSVVLFKKESDKVAVDTFLLSCRAMGRGVEHELLRQVALQADAVGLAHISVPFIPSARNQPALDFLESVPSGVKSKTEEGWLFTYPVTAVTNLSYQPQTIVEHEREAVETVESKSEQAIIKQAPSQQSQQIATELVTVDDILQAVERQNRRQRPTSLQTKAAPQTDLEKTLAEQWRSLLGLDQIGIHDNFFEIGGHSLLATRLLARLNETMQVEIPLRDFFETPTVAILAGHIETLRWLKQKPSTNATELDEREEFEL
jgi:acyl carrier protein